MHADPILTRVLDPCLTRLHAKRAATVRRATLALLRGGTTGLSAIALSLGGNTTLKQRTKSVDRLHGNSGLHLARGELYRCVERRWLKELSPLVLVVDWSDLNQDRR